MLKVKSFKMSDEEGMNEILVEYPMAKGAQVLVSNGEVCIPIEDGEELSNEWKAKHVATQLNDALLSKELMENNIAGMVLMRDKYTKVQKVFEQYDNTIIQSRRQVEEYDTQIQAYRERIDFLKNN